MDEKMKKCPYCGEEILKKAIKCKYCEENIEEQDSVIYKDGCNESYSKFKNKKEIPGEIKKFNLDTFWGICGFALFLLVIFSLGFLLFNGSFEKELFEVYKNDSGKYCFQYNYIENYIINKMTSCHESKEEAEAYAKCYKDSTEGLKEMAEQAEQGGYKNNTSTLLENNVVTPLTVSQCIGVYQTPQQKAEQEAQERAEIAKQKAEEAKQEAQEAENIRQMEKQKAQSLQDERDSIRKNEQAMEQEQQVLKQRDQQNFLNQVKTNQEQNTQNNYNQYQQQPIQQPQYVHKTGNYSYTTTSPQQQNSNSVQHTSTLFQVRNNIDEVNNVTSSINNGVNMIKILTGK